MRLLQIIYNCGCLINTLLINFFANKINLLILFNDLWKQHVAYKSCLNKNLNIYNGFKLKAHIKHLITN